MGRRDAGIEGMKGLLIAFVVLGHNYFFGRYYPFFFGGLYNFHVSSFLLLPFLFSLAGRSRQDIRDRIVRAMVPQSWFVLAVIPVYFWLFVGKDSASFERWLTDICLALTLQNEQLFENATGFRHFWFLPALTLMLVAIYVFDNVGRTGKVVVATLSVVWHLGIGLLDLAVIYFIPWGMPIVGFLFAPGLLVRHIYRNFEWKPQLDYFVLPIWGVGLWASIRYQWFMPLAGDIVDVPSVVDSGSLLLHDLFLILSFFAILRLGSIFGRGVLSLLGHASLKLFLIIPLLWQIFWMAGGRSLHAITPEGQMLVTSLTFLGTLAVGYWTCRLLSGTRIEALLFPKGLRQWRYAWKMLFIRDFHSPT